MDEQHRQALLKSRTDYLLRKAKERGDAAEYAMRERLEEIESGLLPESVVEVDLLMKRASEVEAAKRLLSTAREREEMVSGTNSRGHGDHANDTRHAVQPREVVAGSGVGSASSLGLTATPPVGFDVAPVEGAADSFQFVAMEDHIVRERIAQKNYEADRDEETVKAERAAMMRDQRERLAAQRRSLPIFQVRDRLVRLVQDHPVVVIVGETGSGKTTQLLQYLYEEEMNSQGASRVPRRGGDQPAPCASDPTAGGGAVEAVDLSPHDAATRKYVCTQPRRIAAISVAERVATEVGCRCGSIVGYKVRFDEKTGPLTRIMFVTDGMMLKEIGCDPDLGDVAAIMIDEAHERSLNTDILMGLLKDISRRNTHLKVIVASATINAAKFSEFFNGAPIFTVEGRTFPVEVSYLTDPVADYVTACAETVLMLHATKPIPGDILVFLPGQEQIEACTTIIKQLLGEASGQLRQLIVLPIYSSLPPQEQKLIYQRPPPNSRKVVIATNIAETSITIDGIVYVVDSGLCKQDFYNSSAMVEELRVVPTSQASAMQRTGRAGRTQPGECFRLFTAYTFRNEFPPETVPEILRSSVSSVVLQLKALGIHNLLQFEFIDPPSRTALERSLDHLFFLGAVKQDGRLTVTGRRMAEFPMDPSLSKCLVRSGPLGCARHMAMAAAMLSLDNSIFHNTRDPQERKAVESARDRLFAGGNGDIFGYVRLFEDWVHAGSYAKDFCQSHFINYKSMVRARDVYDQILRTFDRVGIDYVADPQDQAERSVGGSGGIDVEALTKAVLAGFFMNVSRLEVDQRTYSIVCPLEMTASLRSRSLYHTGSETPTAEMHPSSYLHRAGMMRNMTGSTASASPLSSTSFGGLDDPAIPPILRERPALVVFTQLRFTSKRYMIHISAIPSPEWVLKVAPVNYFSREDLVPGFKKRPRG